MRAIALLPLAFFCVCALSLLSSCSVAEDEIPPLFVLEDCKRISLIDNETGDEVVGAEDLDIDRVGGRLIVSAYDRRAVERATRRSSESIPEGGLYVVTVNDLSVVEDRLRAQSIAARTSLAGGLRPHGIAYDEASGQLHFINRAYERQKNRWRMRAQLLTLDLRGETIAAQDVGCTANDIVVHGGQVLLTLDHSGCGLGAGAEDVFGLKRARLVNAAGTTIADGIGFANGVAALADGRVLVAATRERALYPVALKEDGAVKQEAIRLGAAPDNLSISDDGRIIVALHPSLPAIGLQRRLGVGRSPSRIVEIDPKTGHRRLLFDDPKASMISAATVAINTRNLLVIGSVIDSGIVVCRSAS